MQIIILSEYPTVTPGLTFNVLKNSTVLSMSQSEPYNATTIRKSIVHGWKLREIITNNELTETIQLFNDYMSSIPSNDVFFVAFNNLIQSTNNPNKQQTITKILQEFKLLHHSISDNMFNALSTELKRTSRSRNSTIGSLISSHKSSIIEMQTYDRMHDGKQKLAKSPSIHQPQSISPSKQFLASILFLLVLIAAIVQTIWNICYFSYIHTEDQRFVWSKKYYDSYDIINASVAILIMSRSLQLQYKQAKTSIKNHKKSRISNTYQHFRSNLFLTFIVTFYYGLLSTG